MSPTGQMLGHGLPVVLATGLLLSAGLSRLAFAQHRWGIDHPGSQCRKLHLHQVPRLGGVALFLAPSAAGCLLLVTQPQAALWLLALAAISLPCVIAGLWEDLTGRVSARMRLAGMAVSAGLLVSVQGIAIDRIGLEALESVVPFMWILSMLALLTITNGINLIDGLNGLAGMSALLMYLTVGVVALQTGDPLIASCALILAGSMGGFLVWNWPRSHLFMGDAGAYFTGFTLGALAIAVVQRNAAISPWFAVLLLAYPLTEVAFTVWRRATGRRRAIGSPDAMHLHHLVFRRVLASSLRAHRGICLSEARNARASALLWCLPLGCCLLAAVAYAHTVVLVPGLLVFVVVYLRLYFRIAHFRTPRFPG